MLRALPNRNGYDDQDMLREDDRQRIELISAANGVANRHTSIDDFYKRKEGFQNYDRDLWPDEDDKCRRRLEAKQDEERWRQKAEDDERWWKKRNRGR